MVSACRLTRARKGRRGTGGLKYGELQGSMELSRALFLYVWVGRERLNPSAFHRPAQIRMTSPSTSPKTSRAAAKPPASYEAALEELEQLVAQIDAGQLPLDQLLTRYQRGAELLAFCRHRLEAVENQIQQLEGGELKPWSGA